MNSPRLIARDIRSGVINRADNITDDLDEPHELPVDWHREKLKQLDKLKGMNDETNDDNH
jgi:hypothetical protein